MPNHSTSTSLAAILATFAFVLNASGASSPNSDRGLHAGIRAQVVSQKEGNTQPAYVQLSFLLLNDGDSTLDVHPKSWKVVVDGSGLADSGMIFGNGPGPVNGWQPLQPGDHYEFGKGVSIARYFSHPGAYRVSWKGQGFQSATITVKISDIAQTKPPDKPQSGGELQCSCSQPRVGRGGGSTGGVFNVGPEVSAPRLVSSVEPEYTEEARRAGLEGTVVLWAIIDPSGCARHVLVQQALGGGLDEQAVNAVRCWKYEPAKWDGKPVYVHIDIPVKFQLNVKK